MFLVQAVKFQAQIPKFSVRAAAFPVRVPGSAATALFGAFEAGGFRLGLLLAEEQHWILRFAVQIRQYLQFGQQ